MKSNYPPPPILRIFIICIMFSFFLNSCKKEKALNPNSNIADNVNLTQQERKLATLNKEVASILRVTDIYCWA